MRLGVLVALLGIGGIVALRFPLPDRQELVPGPLIEGPWAPLVLGLVHATATLAPVPKNVLSTAAGFVFGLGPGAVTTLSFWRYLLATAAVALLLLSAGGGLLAWRHHHRSPERLAAASALELRNPSEER